MALVVVWVCYGIYWVARPLWPKKLRVDTTILVQPFDFIQEGKVEKSKGDVVAQLVATRIRQIEGVLTKKPDLSRFPNNPQGRRVYLIEGSVGGEVEANVIKSAPLSSDLELKVYGVEVGGILGFFWNQLHEGPKLKGLLKVGADKHEILLTLEGAEAGPEAGGWMLSDGSLQGAIDTISHQFVLDTRRRGNPQLASLSHDQFVAFVEGIASYHKYLQKYNPGDLASEGRDQLLQAKRVLGNLVDKKPVSSLPYMYLASVSTLLDEKDIAEPLRLLRIPVTMAPDNLFVKEQIGRLEAAEATRPGKQEQAVTLTDIRQQPAFQFVNLPAALASLKPQRTIRVAILATGIDSTHKVISNRIVAAKSFVPGETDANDLHGYGTHVAGLVVAAAPQAEIVNVKVLSKNGSGSDTHILAGMEFAAQQKSHIILLSFGSQGGGEKVYETVIRRLTTLGILAIAPAGNDGTESVSYPAGYEGVLSVGATDLKGTRAGFSNFGDKVTIFAPGVDVLSLLPGNQSSRSSGTSNSSAIATGVAALILAGNRDLPATDVSRLLSETAKTTPSVKIIDAAAALEEANRRVP
jgi:hypothetical protein